jgi:hypothetical protein
MCRFPNASFSVLANAGISFIAKIPPCVKVSASSAKSSGFVHMGASILYFYRIDPTYLFINKNVTPLFAFF